MKTILTYGDSNTWGYNPDAKDFSDCRFGRHERWPGLLQGLLGSTFHVVEEGLGGRTTMFDSPNHPGRNGLSWLIPCLQTHQPLDIVVFMLGTNDVNTFYNVPVSTVACGMSAIVETTLKPFIYDTRKAPHILIISPFHIIDCEVFDFIDHTSVEKSHLLATEYAKIAEQYGCFFLDCSEITGPHPKEGLHLSLDGHHALAKAVYKKIVMEVIRQ